MLGRRMYFATSVESKQSLFRSVVTDDTLFHGLNSRKLVFKTKPYHGIAILELNIKVRFHRSPKKFNQ